MQLDKGMSYPYYSSRRSYDLKKRDISYKRQDSKKISKGNRMCEVIELMISPQIPVAKGLRVPRISRELLFGIRENEFFPGW